MKKKIDKSVLTHGISKRWRDQKYMDWLKTQPCAASGYIASEMGGQGVDPAHLGTRGRGLKEHDFYCLPLRHDLHGMLDRGFFGFWLEWAERDQMSIREILKSHATMQYLKYVLGKDDDLDVVSAIVDYKEKQ